MTAKILKSYRIDPELYGRVQEKCARDGVSVTDVIEAAFVTFVEE